MVRSVSDPHTLVCARSWCPRYRHGDHRRRHARTAPCACLRAPGPACPSSATTWTRPRGILYQGPRSRWRPLAASFGHARRADDAPSLNTPSRPAGRCARCRPSASTWRRRLTSTAPRVRHLEDIRGGNVGELPRRARPPLHRTPRKSSWRVARSRATRSPSWASLDRDRRRDVGLRRWPALAKATRAFPARRDRNPRRRLGDDGGSRRGAAVSTILCRLDPDVRVPTPTSTLSLTTRTTDMRFLRSHPPTPRRRAHRGRPHAADLEADARAQIDAGLGDVNRTRPGRARRRRRIPDEEHEDLEGLALMPSRR